MNKTIKLESPIDFFGKWAECGKDEGMEKGHAKSVQFMFNKILENQKDSFSFLDAGCGNGWVVRKMKEQLNCIYSSGIDGAKQMIEKARSIDSESDYFLGDLLDWDSTKKYDIIHSMEVFYYFNNPIKLVEKIHKNWLSNSGKLIFGIDHYKENKSSLNWPEECGVYMNTKSIQEWEEILVSVGFKNIKFWQIGEKEDWAGTLVFYSEK